MKLLLFLGNPGKKYEQTRHNAGFMIGDRLAERFGKTEWVKKNNYLGVRLAAPEALLIKPQTFMNLSGEVFRWLPDTRKEDILVVSDDFALPLGKLRFREKGSCGGHNGLRSVEQHLGGTDYPRMRFGVGGERAVRGEEFTGYVLGSFPPDERERLAAALELAAAACADWLTHGIQFCQDKYNGGRSG